MCEKKTMISIRLGRVIAWSLHQQGVEIKQWSFEVYFVLKTINESIITNGTRTESIVVNNT